MTGQSIWVHTLAILVLLVADIQPMASSSRQLQSTATEKGELILNDNKLFPGVDAGSFVRFINSLGLKISARPVGGGTKIADVQAKYGKADRTETLAANQELVRLKACTLDAIVHWYGQYGFCVAPSETEVFGLVFVKKAS